ncbi:MAG: proline hydroxylase [Richelia sp. RM2_1_2]|nr:proline hydroxylase [Richelia sp. SM1_7_0]NJN10449.1 proline hydroxylase [Richelia sp. RM1_1_1]NJO62786.1 proline hydroxylase [Richelia sp. RM2_1_2]
MRLVAKNTQFVVFDDFLSVEDFELVKKYIHDENYQIYDASQFDRVYRLFDGKPLIGKSSRFSEKFPGVYSHDQKNCTTLTGIDVFVEHLLSNSEILNEWIGKKDIDWKGFTAKVYLYPQGSGLTWHDDGGNKTGSYAFYTHPSWNVQWGGDLLIPDESTKNHDYQLVTIIKSDNRYDKNKNIEVGMGQYIAPKPNRLVVIAGENPHRINKVEPTAGDRIRSSISGFFVKCNYI